MTDHEQELKNFLIKCTEAATWLGGINSSTRSDPTDKEGQRLALEFVFRTIEESELLAVYTKFYVLYFSGFVDSGDDCSAVLYDVISCTMVEDEPLIPDKYRKSTSTYFVNVGQAHMFIVNETRVVTYPESVDENGALRKTFRSSFASVVKAILESWAKTDVDSVRLRDQFKSLTGFLALTLLRLFVKTVSTVSNAFCQLKYKNNLTAMTEWTDTSVFEPPCKKCLELCRTNFSKSTLKERCIFAVLAMIYIDRLNKGKSDAMLRYICASVMDDTAWVRLGVLDLLQQAETILNVGWKKIMKDSWTYGTTDSWKEIGTVLLGVLEKVHGTEVWYVEWNKFGLLQKGTGLACLGRDMWNSW